jgi:hypothetical protein
MEKKNSSAKGQIESKKKQSYRNRGTKKEQG